MVLVVRGNVTDTSGIPVPISSHILLMLLGFCYINIELIC